MMRISQFAIALATLLFVPSAAFPQQPSASNTSIPDFSGIWAGMASRLDTTRATRL